MAKVINDWNELYGLENEKYKIVPDDLEEDNGWIYDKETKEFKEYLSTHTFYEQFHKYSTELLQKYGFDVELVSWG